MDFSDHLLTTNGILSTVTDSDGDDLGHVLFADYDSQDPHTVKEDAEGLPGVTLVFESSPGSYHLWNLTVRTTQQVALKQLELRQDPAYAAPGYRRGYWRLRVGAKLRPSNDVAKEAPELVGITLNETDRQQSRPHWQFAQAKHDIPDLPIDVELVGDSVDEQEYGTLSEWGKELARGESDPSDPPDDG